MKAKGILALEYDLYQSVTKLMHGNNYRNSKQNHSKFPLHTH